MNEEKCIWVEHDDAESEHWDTPHGRVDGIWSYDNEIEKDIVCEICGKPIEYKNWQDVK